MRIVEVRPVVVGSSWRNLTFVIVRTDEGIEGIGEVRFINNTNALLGYLADAVPNHVLGHDPFAIEALIQRVWRHDYGRPGQVEMSGLAAIEIACWDIMGKALGQPVYRLLGGPVRDRVKAYANGWYTVERTPAAFHAAARRVIERGYRALKLDPFGSGSYELSPPERRRALELIEAVRAAIGTEVELLIEMHGRFSPSQAIALARDLEQFDPAWIEEPVPPENPRVMKRVADRVNIPVAAGERIHLRPEFRELIELQACDVVQVDLTMSGGIAEGRKIASWAENYSLLMAPHNVGGPVSTAAALHFAAATPNFKLLEHFNDFAEPHVKEVAPGLPEVTDGYFTLPDRPGLGIAFDEDLAGEYPQRAINFDLFEDNWHLRQAARDVQRNP
ncbi:MAG TPA: mandelate racemase/muconate lactonizing enzyme family protein [Chloroflexota bacterium]|nr:mandelate racemase/muconate lactonizing enzyme family protein [Chloroflexota bacterium]